MLHPTPAPFKAQIERDPDLRTAAMKDLFATIAMLKTPLETKQFFRDLCTRAELKEMATRWQVVRCLQRKLPYLDIAKKTGASTATVTRVANWLHHGMGGYTLMLHRLRAIH